jgi:hypothetical protein
MSRYIYLICGWTAVALGLIGILLPVLPTTPFMILAAFLFTKGSPNARAWLIEHAHFGPHIQNWEASGAIAPRAKRTAVLMMAGVLSVSLFLGLPWWLIGIQAICMGGAAAFILTRPDAVPDAMPDAMPDGAPDGAPDAAPDAAPGV